MDGIVVGDKSYLSTGRTGQLVQTCGDGRGDTFQHSTPYRRETHINHKEVTGWLGRTDHVFTGSDEFDNTLGEFGALVFVAALTVFVEVAEVGGGAFVALGADVATPGAAVFEPGDKGVDVGSAPN